MSVHSRMHPILKHKLRRRQNLISIHMQVPIKFGRSGIRCKLDYTFAWRKQALRALAANVRVQVLEVNLNAGMRY